MKEAFQILRRILFRTATEGFKSDECVIDKLDFSIGVKHKKPDPPDFPGGRLFTVSSEDEWRIYQAFILEDNAKEYELVGEFSRFLY